ncbi:MAG TPA: ribosome biogenesis GTP-binding protein YihA/YsxC [Longimicrobiaceae bacterium]
MHIKSVSFAGAIGQPGQAPPESVAGLAQIAFSGRSNVGKSSLINRLLGRTRTPIARVSQNPGKTQEINFYHVRAEPDDFCLVDLPGYGYARVPKAVRERWRPLINAYLAGDTAPRGVVQLIDMRHGPSREDMVAIDYLAELKIPVLFVLTKADKLNATQRAAAMQKIPGRLGVDPDQVLPVSAHSGQGIEHLLETIGALLE